MRRIFQSAILLVFLAGCAGPGSVAPRAIGTDGSDPKWAPYAGYLERAIARVQQQWERELADSRLPPPEGATVTVVFLVSPDGKVARIEEVKSEPEGIGVKPCVAAITRAGTFGPWTEEMKKVLGPEEKMIFTFVYEKEPPPRKRSTEDVKL